MALPQICIFNPVTTLIDQIQAIDSGPAAYGIPVVTNLNGVIDTSLLGLGISAIAGQDISSGQLVNLYSNAGALTAQLASAQASGTAPSGASYPIDAQGYATVSATTGAVFTVGFFGPFKYIDSNSEFTSAAVIGLPVYLSTRGDGSVTLTPPAGVGELEQAVGYVVSWTTPNIVQINFIAGFQDFSHISGVNPISKGGTGATTGAQALINLIAGSPAVGQSLVWNGTAWVPGSDPTSFTLITTGTNTTATMTVGTGATLTFSGTGVINASAINGVTITNTGTVGQVLTAINGISASWQTLAMPAASPTNSIQFNNAGALGGSANLVWNNASNYINVTGQAAIGDGTQSPGQIDGIVIAGYNNISSVQPATGASTLDVAVQTTTFPTGDITAAMSVGLEINPAADASAETYYGGFVEAYVPGTNAQPAGTITALQGQADHYGSGTASIQGVAGLVYVGDGTTATPVSSVVGVYALAQFNSTSTATDVIGISSNTNMYVGTTTNVKGAEISSLSGSGTVTNQFGVNVSSQVQTSTGATANTGIAVTAISGSTGTVVAQKGISANTTLNAIGGVISNDYTIFIEQPTLSSGTATHHYGLYIDDQTVGGASNPDPYAIYVNGGTSVFPVILLGSHAPATLTSTGKTGDITWDGGRQFVCTAPNVWNFVPMQSLVTIPYSATPTLNLDLGSSFTITLTGDATMSLSGGFAGQQFTIMVVQDGVGGHTLTWSANFHGGVTNGTTASLVSPFSYIFDGTNAYLTGSPIVDQ